MNANGRRARQAAQGYTHLKRGGKGPSRPIYKHKSLESQIEHEKRVRETMRRIAQGKNKK